MFFRSVRFCMYTICNKTLNNPILLGGDNFVLHPKFIQKSSIWPKLHKNIFRYVLEIYFCNFFQQIQIYQQVTWPPYDVIMEFDINSMVKLSQNQKCCNFVKNWYIRTKFYREVHFKDYKWSKMNFEIISKNFPIFPDFQIFNEKWHFWVILD